MVKTFLIYVISSAFLIGLFGVLSFMLNQNADAIKTGSCPNMKFLEAHTYGAWSLAPSEGSRLKALHECVILEGVVRADPTISDEKDGDLKFDVDPDQGFKDLENSFNKKGIVVEVICWGPVDYSKYNYYKWINPKFCEGVEPHKHPEDYPIGKVKQGTHVRVIGKHVQDVGCCPLGVGGKWNEIHPVERIEILK